MTGMTNRLYVVKPPRATRRTNPWWHSLHTVRRHTCLLLNDEQIVSHFQSAEDTSVWLVPRAADLAVLPSEVSAGLGRYRLLVFSAVSDPARHFLGAYFRHVLASQDAIHLLDAAELFHVLVSPRRNDLFIGGTVDPDERAVVLYRGTVEPLVVPLAWFTPRPGGPRPDPKRLRIIDFGQTVQLGEYEAAASAILYEFDTDYRRRQRKVQRETDTSFGGSLRRLRLQKGKARTDFPGIAEKTLARLERNEIARPHAGTLAAIAKRLGVPVEELGTY